MLTNKEVLKDRFEATQKRLEASLATLKADVRASSKAEVERVSARLAELRDSVKDGWDNLTEEAAERVNKVLNRMASNEHAASSEQNLKN